MNRDKLIKLQQFMALLENLVDNDNEYQNVYCELLSEVLDIDKEKLMESAKAYGKSPYGAHLRSVAEGKVRY